MKTKQKSFIHNSSKKLSTYRPNSSTKNSRIPVYNINNSFSDLYPPITLTMPTQRKPSRIGNQITREELYEENIHLKDKINKMRRELDETKNKLFKRGLELNKKEKIIRDVSKENVTEYTHEKNLDKAKESALLTLCKNKYNDMKIKYQKKCEENEILKANIKITKLKEYEIKIDVFKKEMEKIRNLYTNCQNNYDKSMKEIKEMDELKKEFFKQHSIINSLNKKIKELYNEINSIQNENFFLKNELNKYGKKEKILKNKNLKLKISNEKYMKLKKRNDSSVIINNDNIRKLNNLKKDLAEYKLLNSQLNEKYNNLLNNKKGVSKNINKNILDLKPFNYEEVKIIEKTDRSENQTKLYKSLLEEAKMKISILENYLRENDINPEIILRNKGYEGIINLNTNKNMIKLQKMNKTSTNNSTNTKDATSVGTKEVTDLSKNLNNTQSNFENINKNDNNKNNIINNEINKDENNEEINNNENINNININNENNEERKEEYNQKENKEEIKDTENDNNNYNIENAENKENNETEENNQENQDSMKITQSQNSEFNTQERQAKETQFLAILHTFVKNLEANHITKETLINKIKEISLLFENKEEATKEEFIEPFINLFIESMKITQSNDIQLINDFFNNFIEDMEGDTNRFFLELIDIFENIVDYTLVENEEEVLNAIAMELQPYKEELKLKLEKHENNIITFDNLRQVIEELNISLTDDYTEFLIYKMKEKVPPDSSIFDLNYKIILDLLDKNTNTNTNENNNNIVNNSVNENNNNETNTNNNENEGNNNEKKINEEDNESNENNEMNMDEEEMNIQMSNKLSELKQALKDNKTTLEEECNNKVKILEDQNNTKINGINKDVFFDLMNKYNIEIEDKVKESIFDLFKIENDILVKSEGELFLLDFDKLCSILDADAK